MLLGFTQIDAYSSKLPKSRFYVNPKYIVSISEGMFNAYDKKTVISTVNGGTYVDEPFEEVKDKYMNAIINGPKL